MWQNAFIALVAESAKRSMPTAFEDDLYKHDRAYLEKENPPRFGWILRDYGTHLFDPRCRGAVGWFEAAIKVYPAGLLYWYNGTSLEPVSPSEMRMLLAVNQASPATGE